MHRKIVPDAELLNCQIPRGTHYASHSHRYALHSPRYRGQSSRYAAHSPRYAAPSSLRARHGPLTGAQNSRRAGDSAHCARRMAAAWPPLSRKSV